MDANSISSTVEYAVRIAKMTRSSLKRDVIFIGKGKTINDITVRKRELNRLLHPDRHRQATETERDHLVKALQIVNELCASLIASAPRTVRARGDAIKKTKRSSPSEVFERRLHRFREWLGERRCDRNRNSPDNVAHRAKIPVLRRGTRERKRTKKAMGIS